MYKDLGRKKKPRRITPGRGGHVRLLWVLKAIRFANSISSHCFSGCIGSTHDDAANYLTSYFLNRLKIEVDL